MNKLDKLLKEALGNQRKIDEAIKFIKENEEHLTEEQEDILSEIKYKMGEELLPEIKKLKRTHKNLYFLEAGYIYCKRRGIEYDDKFIDEIFMDEQFDSSEGSEFDKICKDLRCYKYFDSYELIEITDEEYEMCVDKFRKD